MFVNWIESIHKKKHELRNKYDKNLSQENEVIYKTHHNKLTSLMRTA